MTSGDHRSAAIVVGVDGTPCADLALRWAADTARRHVRPLQIVHVTDGGAERLTTGYQSPSGEATAGAGEVLAKAAAEVNRHNPGVAVTTRLVDDEPGRGLVAAAAGASMVVVGSRGHGGLHDLVLGSVSLYLAEHAGCPVAIVRGDGVPPDGTRPDGTRPDGTRRSVVVGIDGSAGSTETINVAVNEAVARGLRLHVVHTWHETAAAITPTMAVPPPTDAETLRTAGQHVLDSAVARARTVAPDLAISGELIQAAPDAALLAASATADLLVAGRRSHARAADVLLGSVSTAALHHADCPVVIVPHAADAEDAR